MLAANSDIEPDSPVAADSPPKALCRIQTGQNSLSAVAKNFVPQTGQVRASCCTDLGSLPGSLIGSPDSVFTASVFRRRVLDFEFKTLSRLVHWIGEQRLLDGG